MSRLPLGGRTLDDWTDSEDDGPIQLCARALTPEEREQERERLNKQREEAVANDPYIKQIKSIMSDNAIIEEHQKTRAVHERIATVLEKIYEALIYSPEGVGAKETAKEFQMVKGSMCWDCGKMISLSEGVPRKDGAFVCLGEHQLVPCFRCKERFATHFEGGPTGRKACNKCYELLLD